MVIDVKPILQTGLAAQSLALAGKNIELVRNGKGRKRITPRKLVRTGVTNIVGIPLIRTQAGLIAGI